MTLDLGNGVVLTLTDFGAFLAFWLGVGLLCLVHDMALPYLRSRRREGRA
jgi:hypothetical protein